MEHRPAASLVAGGHIEFLLSGAGKDYKDMTSTYLYLRARVIKADGANLDKDSAIGAVNNFVEQHARDPFNEHVRYRAYIETLLSHGADTK